MRHTARIDSVVKIDTAKIVPAQDGMPWSGTHSGRVVNLAAWRAAGYPCPHCGLIGGH